MLASARSNGLAAALAGLSSLALAAGLAWGGGTLAYAAPVAVPLAAAVAAGAAATLVHALRGKAWAIGAIAAFVALVLSIQFRVREIGDVGLDWQNGMKFVAWAAILGVAAFRHRRLAPLLRDPAMALVVAYGCVAIASTAWSSVPTYTGANAMGLLAYACLAGLMAVELGETLTLRVLVGALSALMLGGLAAGLVAPDSAFMPPSNVETAYRLIGLASHPNALGQQAAVLCLLAVAARRSGALGRREFLVALAIGVVALMASRSRFSLVAFLASWAFVAYRGRGVFPLVAMAAALAVAAMLTYAGLRPLPDINALFGERSRTGSSSEILTLTGRTELWSVAADRIAEKPFLGWGFNATEGLLAEGLPRDFAGSGVNAHNMIVQTLLSLGILGSLPGLGFLAIQVARMYVRPDDVRDQVTLFVMIVGMGEVEIFAVPVLLTLVAYWSVARHAASRRSPGPSLAWSGAAS